MTLSFTLLSHVLFVYIFYSKTEILHRTDTQFYAILQSALLDLLGTTDVAVTMPATTSKNSSPSSTAVAHNNDLLDLLGSLDLNTPTPAPTLPPQPQVSTPIFSPTNTSSSFLVDGLLSSPSVQNGTCPSV